jgi:uncharacterized repeat protein (TIGR03803 family)
MSFAKFAQSLFLLFVGMSAIITPRPAHAQRETILHKFRGGSDGEAPSGLVSDGQGNFYGTTIFGGIDGYYGTAFELSPSGKGWKETVLYRFTGGADGAFPMYSNLIFDSLGNLYGTTYEGGTYNYGTVFELSPVGSEWTESVLYSFTSYDAGCPLNGLIRDSAGNFYGTHACEYGAGICGVFELSLSGNTWTEQQIYSVVLPDQSTTGLAIDDAGNIFGVGHSIAFELYPNGRGGWTPTVIHKFGSHPLGYIPEGGPVLDKAGNVYGTTIEGGAYGYGVVYKLSPRKKPGPYTETVLYSFTGGQDGACPVWGLVFDAAGNIYGTTDYCYNGKVTVPTVFELVAPVRKGSYQQKTLWTFDGTDGGDMGGSIVMDSAGNLYGATNNGGLQCPDDFTCGLAFKITP